MQTFQYKTTGILNEDELNDLGAEGWELVSSTGVRSIFKRVKPPADSGQLPLPSAGKKPPREKLTT